MAKLQSDTAAPSSFVEEGAPDSFADLDAKLKVRGSYVHRADEMFRTVVVGVVIMVEYVEMFVSTIAQRHAIRKYPKHRGD